VAGLEPWPSTGGEFYHWDGSSWRTETIPGEACDVAALWGLAADDVWAICNNGFLTMHGRIAHWDGTSWRLVHGEGGSLSGLWGSATDDVWAVGAGGQMVHWDGAAWSSSPCRPSSPDDLWGLWGVAGYGAWAVGRNGAVLRLLE
jgi:hypothetical protein